MEITVDQRYRVTAQGMSYIQVKTIKLGDLYINPDGTLGTHKSSASDWKDVPVFNEYAFKKEQKK